jgi:hypothetical protein
MRDVVRLRRTAAMTLAVLLAAVPAFADATVILLNANAPGVGLNDPTPVAPVAGNTGTTLGAQRLIALQRAADIWGATLDSPVPIVIQVAFLTRSCTATGAVLASAGATAVSSDFGSVGSFPGPVAPATWHHSALADKRAGVELIPGIPDVQAIFNINLGQPGCLTGSPFYYGLDANEGNAIDLVAVALHEFGHGLGFQTFVNLGTGANFLGLTDVYARNLLDQTVSQTWDVMTDAQRAASAINARKVVWDGARVFADVPSVLELGTPLLRVTAPAAIAGIYDVGTASFGAALSSPGVTGQIVAALDAANAAGPTTFDACTPLTNAAAVTGRIALVDRGTCGFIVKAANVQAAGAVAMIVADNAPGAPPAGLGGLDPSITIPSVRVTITDGSAIRAQLGAGVTATLGVDTTRRAGVDATGRVYMNATNPIVPGSSISHWDPLAFRNLLMEPNVNADLTHSLVAPDDLTLPQMRDVGWFADSDNDGFDDDTADECDSSDLRATLFVGGTNTGVANLMFTNGCTMSDYVIAAAADARNHGGFVSAVAHLGNAWRAAGLITDEERSAIQTAAAHSSVGKKK